MNSTETTSLSIRNQSCKNQNCKQQGQECAGNVVIHSQKERRFQCNSCKSTWVAHRNKPEYRLRKPKIKIVSAYNLISNGASVRKAAKILEVSPNTIQRWKAKFAEFQLNTNQQGDFVRQSA